jgi:lipopolysaccharide export LptBFGC system permease protein LptF
MAVGAMLMLLFMLGAAAMSPDIPVNVRVGFLIFGGIMIFTMVTVVLGFITPLSQTGPTIIG